jgi:hypothetical protein
MGEARKKAEVDPEEAKVLPAREALSLIWSRPPEADEDASGRGEEPLGTEDGSVEGPRGAATFPSS